MSSSREFGGREKKRTVPKFASFKPKSEPGPESQSEDSGKKDAEKTNANRPHRHGDSRHDRDGERDGRREQEHRHRHKRRSPPRHGGKVTSAEASSSSSSSLFFTDKRGDPLILRYGSNDRGKVPLYHRFGAGKVLGSSGLLCIHRDGAREQFTIRSHRRDDGSAFRDKNAILAAAARRSGAKRIRPEPGAAHLPTASDDFISVEPSRKRKRGEDGPTSVSEYSSIYRKAEDSESDSDDTSSSTSEGGEAVVELTSTKKRSIELSRRVRDDPSDIPSWLELIKLQDALFRENHGLYAEENALIGTTEEAKGLAELKLSLYEEALPNARQPADKESLLEGAMREGARVWDAKSLAKRWDEVSKSHPESFVLWRARLNFELARVITCNYEELKELLVGKLQSLNKKLRGACNSATEAATEDVATLCDQSVYVFLRLSRFLRDSGYVELAVAAWQAVLELTFCRPATLPSDQDGTISLFSDFWESEVPRIGEDGAKGWRHFVDDAEGMADPPDPKPYKRGETPQTRDVFKAWAMVETQAAGKSRMPARTLDEGAEDDPYRVVMFSDIKDLLFWFPVPALPHAGPRLLDAYLLFCGFPTARISDGLVDSARRDPYVAGRSEAFEYGLSLETSNPVLRRAPEFRQQGGDMVLCQEVLFPGEAWFQYINKCRDTRPTEADQVDVAWVLGTLKHLVKACWVEALAEYYLAMEWLNQPASAKKAAKGLLKLYSANVRLYSGYARIEWANGNTDVSEKVLSAATSQGLSPTSTDNQILWNTWAWIQLESGQKQAALTRLCSSVDKKLDTSNPSLPRLLKARSHFPSARDYALSSQKPETSIAYAESLVLLEYLSAEGSGEATSEAQGNITAALASVRRFSDELTSHGLGKSPLHEQFLQTAAHLLYHHATHGPHRPAYIRTQLQHFASLFPRNAIFLELFAWAESALRIDDPVRTHLRRIALIPPHDLLGTHRFAIRHEARAGTAHSTRAAFEAALDSEACRGNAELWVWYIRFCYGEKELKRRAKDVFYRAIAACPMAKDVYMEGFRTVVKEMGTTELRAVFNTMTAKGLRVHADLDEWEEKWGEQHARHDTLAAQR